MTTSLTALLKLDPTRDGQKIDVTHGLVYHLYMFITLMEGTKGARGKQVGNVKTVEGMLAYLESKRAQKHVYKLRAMVQACADIAEDCSAPRPRLPPQTKTSHKHAEPQEDEHEEHKYASPPASPPSRAPYQLPKTQDLDEEEEEEEAEEEEQDKPLLVEKCCRHHLAQKGMRYMGDVNTYDSGRCHGMTKDRVQCRNKTGASLS